MILFVLFAILSTISGQLGPSYDPLFFDQMIYLAAGIIFLIIIVIVIIIAVWAVLKKRKNKQFQKSPDDSLDDSTNEKKWDGI